QFSSGAIAHHANETQRTSVRVSLQGDGLFNKPPFGDLELQSSCGFAGLVHALEYFPELGGALRIEKLLVAGPEDLLAGTPEHAAVRVVQVQKIPAQVNLAVAV